MLGRVDRYQEAIQCYDKALAIDPKNTGAWNNKGLALTKSGCYQEAHECFDKSLAIMPGNNSAQHLKFVANAYARSPVTPTDLK